MANARVNLRAAVGLPACLLLFAGCNKGNSTGSPSPSPDKATGRVQTASGSSVSGTTADFKPVIPKGCSAEGVTQTKLLTPSAKNGDPAAYLDFEVALTDCSGIFQLLRPGKLSFDMDSYYDIEKMRYTVTFSDNSSGTGSFQITEGVDRFGNKGADFSSVVSTTSYYPPAATMIAKVRVYLGGFVADLTPMPTYLRLGNAAPVSTMVDFED